MTTATNNETEAIKLDRGAKILLLTILQQGFITREQKSDVQKLLQIPLVRLCYADSQEVLKELKEYEARNNDVLTHDLKADRKSILEAVNVAENDGKQ